MLTRSIYQANLDIQYTEGISFPTPNIYYSTGGSPPFIPDEGTDTNSNEPYLDWLNFILNQTTIPQTVGSFQHFLMKFALTANVSSLRATAMMNRLFPSTMLHKSATCSPSWVPVVAALCSAAAIAVSAVTVFPMMAPTRESSFLASLVCTLSKRLPTFPKACRTP